jgi:pSer/pThr/pTyr-binding forkhead associated (FHA) protein
MSADPTGGAWLISLPGNPRTLNLQLKPGKSEGLLLGRAKDCDLRLPSDFEEVSRRHARVLNQSGRWLLVDLGSSWGTRVNGVTIPPNCPVPIGDGSVIYIHPWTFRFCTDPTGSPIDAKSPTDPN